MKKKLGLIILVCFVAVCSICFTACADRSNGVKPGQPLPAYDESGFEGTGLVGVPSLLDMVGYGTLSSYEFFQDGSVALNRKFYAPLKNARTGEGFVISFGVERRDGVFDVMTESANTGALFVLTDDTSLDIRTRHRIYVVGIDDETSYLVVSGAESASGSTTYYERRYLIPLGGYYTGAPLSMQVAYYKNAYYITVTDEDGQSVFKKIDKNTAFTENPGFSSNMKSFFESEKVERVLGLESLDYKAKFSSVQFKLGDGNAAPYANVEKHTVTAVNTTQSGGNIAVSDDNPYKGDAVTVTVQPNDGHYLRAFTVDGVNRKYRLSRAAEGAYQYEIIGVQKDTSVEVVYAEGVEQTYAVTGTYAYTSGVYNADTDTFENAGDVVSVRAGMYEGTAGSGEFTIYLPAEYCEIELGSKKFPSAKKSLTVQSATDIGEIRFTRLNFTRSVSYSADGSLTFNAAQTNRLFDEAAATEGFVVNYTVKGSTGGYFNTGGLYMVNEDETYDYIFVYHSGSSAQIVLIDSDYLWHNGPTYLTSHRYSDCTNEIEVTVIYYNNEFHIILDNEYKCTINASTKLDTASAGLDDQGKPLGADFFAAKSRSLGLRNFDSAATFTNVSYGLGNAAAEKAMERLNVAVKATAGTGGAVSLRNGVGAVIGANTVQGLGERITAQIIPESGKVISSFIVNGESAKHLLEGPFDRDGQRVYNFYTKARVGGVDMNVAFAETQTAYKVTGTYRYDGVRVGETVTVTAGETEGTAQNGTFTIDLPDGTHVLTLTDENGKQTTKQITVRGENVSAGELVFRKAKFADETRVEEVENGYKVTAGHNLLDGVVASEGFVLKYTVKGVNSSKFFNSGAVYFEKNGVRYSIVVLSKNGKPLVGFQQADLGANSVDYHYPDCAYDSIDKEIDVTVIYYQKTFYVRLGDGTPLVVKGTNNGFINGNFFDEGYRAIGFRAWDEAGTFTNISYKLGNEFAKEAVDALPVVVGKWKESMFENGTAAKGEGWVVTVTVKGTYSNEVLEHGGIYMKPVGSAYENTFTVGDLGKTDGMYLIMSVQSKATASPWRPTRAIKLADTYDKTKDVTITVINYKNVLYFKVVTDGKTYTATYDGSKENRAKWSYHYGDQAPPEALLPSYQCDVYEQNLGLSGLHAATAFENVSYAIGNEAARTALGLTNSQTDVDFGEQGWGDGDDTPAEENA